MNDSEVFADRLKRIERNARTARAQGWSIQEHRDSLREWHIAASNRIKELSRWESGERKKTDLHAPARAKIYRDRRAKIERLIKGEYSRVLSILKEPNFKPKSKGAKMAKRVKKAKIKVRKSGRVSVRAHTRRYPK